MSEVDRQTRWVFARNCALTPRQLVLAYVWLSAVSLCVAVFFWWQGAVLVLPFAVLELLAVGVGFGVYARHATDRESLWIDGTDFVVEHEWGGTSQRVVFPRQWVRIEAGAGPQGLVSVVGSGQQVQVGRYVRPEQRPGLARALRLALVA